MNRSRMYRLFSHLFSVRNKAFLTFWGSEAPCFGAIRMGACIISVRSERYRD